MKRYCVEIINGRNLKIENIVAKDENDLIKIVKEKYNSTIYAIRSEHNLERK